MRDLGPAEVEFSRSVAQQMADSLADVGFQRLDTPILEHTDLFVRKSGGEIASSLYSFPDPGGVSVSLRPEFTPSVIRWLIEDGAGNGAVRRLQYSGPVFRYGGSRGSRFRQFHQVGAELIGVPGCDGDTEILRTACRCLTVAGVPNFTIRLGHIGVVRDLVAALGLSEPLQLFVVANLDALTSDRAALIGKASAAGLIMDDDSSVDAGQNADRAMPLVEAFRRSVSGATGRRSADEIVSRLMGRLRQACSREELENALSSVARLVSSRGRATEVVASALALLESSGASLANIEELEGTVAGLRLDGVDESEIRIDLSFVRGMAYYTGVVFEFLNSSAESEFQLGGGGRYDDLVRAFGGPDLPACGFALNLDELTWCFRDRAIEGGR